MWWVCEISSDLKDYLLSLMHAISFDLMDYMYGGCMKYRLISWTICMVGA